MRTMILTVRLRTREWLKIYTVQSEGKQRVSGMFMHDERAKKTIVKPE